DELAPARRATLHRAIGEATETLLGDRLDGVLPALAKHFQLAGATDRALDYTERAGRRALAQVAYEDAVGYLDGALHLLDAVGSSDDARRVSLLQALADARRRAGDVEGCRRALQEAAAVARRLGDAQVLAHVALAFGWSFELG